VSSPFSKSLPAILALGPETVWHCPYDGGDDGGADGDDDDGGGDAP